MTKTDDDQGLVELVTFQPRSQHLSGGGPYTSERCADLRRRLQRLSGAKDRVVVRYVAETKSIRIVVLPRPSVKQDDLLGRVKRAVEAFERQKK